MCHAVRQENRCRHLWFLLRPNDYIKWSYLTLLCMHGVIYLCQVASNGVVAPSGEPKRWIFNAKKFSFIRTIIKMIKYTLPKNVVEYLVRKGKVHITVHILRVLLNEHHVDRTNALHWITSLFRLEHHMKRQALYSPIKNMFFTCARPWKKYSPEWKCLCWG